MVRETKYRSLMKTISWRLMAMIAMGVLVYFFTGRLEWALAVGGIDFVGKIVLYFVHERVWDRIHFGRKEVKPAVIWLTGLSGAGKTTIAEELCKKLRSRGLKVEHLDGDEIRDIFPKTGFGRKDRNDHINRVGYLASRLERNGVFVVASLISPYEESRNKIRSLCQNFIEVYVSTPIEECEYRDVKGLYAKARAGSLKGFTGVDDPYEVPRFPELSINTAHLSLDNSVREIVRYVDAVEAGVVRGGARLADFSQPMEVITDHGQPIGGISKPEERPLEVWMDELDKLENKSIHLLREAYSQIPNLCMLWSIGKDSTVLLWLARKAFFGNVPFPLVHIDTSFKIPQMIEYRNKWALDWGLNLIVGTNESAIVNKETFPDGKVDRLTCCKNLKSTALTRTLNGESKRYKLNHRTKKLEVDNNQDPYRGVIVGIRSDEEGSRSKERYFSPRNKDNHWELESQPPEFWNQFKTNFAPGTHVRIHPLLDWTELNIWEYIAREKMPVVPLYFDQGEGRRYRSLGCYPCTGSVASDARSAEDIVVELREGKFSKVAERSGRAQDKDDGGTLEALRRDGYM